MTWATSVPILVFLGHSVLDLGPMYATDVKRQTASSLNAPPRGRGHNNERKCISTFKTHFKQSLCTINKKYSVKHEKYHKLSSEILNAFMYNTAAIQPGSVCYCVQTSKWSEMKSSNPTTQTWFYHVVRHHNVRCVSHKVNIITTKPAMTFGSNMWRAKSTAFLFQQCIYFQAALYLHYHAEQKVLKILFTASILLAAVASSMRITQ